MNSQDRRRAQLKLSTLRKLKLTMDRYDISLDDITEFLSKGDKQFVSPKTLVKASRNPFSKSVTTTTKTITEDIKKAVAPKWGAL